MSPESKESFEKELELEIKNSEEIKQYAEKVKSMSKEELEGELKKLDEDLADEENEMRLLIGQTGVHISASKIESYRESFARSMAKIKEKQRLVKQELEGK